MIRRITKLKYGGRIYNSVVVLDKQQKIIIAPSLYLANLSILGRSDHTIYNYSHTLNKYFKFLYSKGINWFDVTDIEMSSFIYSKFQKDQKILDSTIKLYTKVLEEFYKWAWESDYLNHPIKFNFSVYFVGSNLNYKKNFKISAKALASQYINKKKFNNLLENLTTSDDFLLQRNELILSIAYYMGLRRSEITDPLNFTINEVQSLVKKKGKTKYLSIIGKGGKYREVIVVKKIERIILRHLNSPLFPSNARSLICNKEGKPITGQTAYLAFKKAAKASMDPYWDTRVFHSLRHTFATNMITFLFNSGQQNYHCILSDMMGHKNEETTNIYISFEDFLNNRNSLHGRLAIKPKFFKHKGHLRHNK